MSSDPDSDWEEICSPQGLVNNSYVIVPPLVSSTIYQTPRDQMASSSVAPSIPFDLSDSLLTDQPMPPSQPDPPSRLPTPRPPDIYRQPPIDTTNLYGSPPHQVAAIDYKSANIGELSGDPHTFNPWLLKLNLFFTNQTSISAEQKIGVTFNYMGDRP